VLSVLFNVLISIMGFATNINLVLKSLELELSASSYVVILSLVIMFGLGMLLNYLSTVAKSPGGLYDCMAKPPDSNAHVSIVLIVFPLMTIDCNLIIFLPFKKSDETKFLNGFTKRWLVKFCNAASLVSSIVSCASAIADYNIHLKSGGVGASISTLIASIALLIYNIIKCWLLRQSLAIFDCNRSATGAPTAEEEKEAEEYCCTALLSCYGNGLPVEFIPL
jgi:hypothetical protein